MCRAFHGPVWVRQQFRGALDFAATVHCEIPRAGSLVHGMSSPLSDLAVRLNSFFLYEKGKPKKGEEKSLTKLTGSQPGTDSAGATRRRRDWRFRGSTFGKCSVSPKVATLKHLSLHLATVFTDTVF